MNFFILTSLINGVLATLFGFFVYLKNWKSLVNKNFFLMCIGVAIWSFSYVKWLSVSIEESALFWSKMLNLGATLIPVFYLHWILAFLNLDRKKRGVIIFGYLITFIFLLFSFTPYYIRSVKPVLSFPYWPQAGPFYVCFIILGYIGLVGYGLYQLFKNRKIVIKEKRNQIDYIILGTILGFGGGATNFPLMFGISLFPPYGQPLVSVYPIIFTFAILKYHLFEIRVILTEILVGVMGIILLVLPFLMPSFNLRILTFAIFLLFLIFGYYLIRATHQESKRREEAEKLAAEERALRLKTERLTRAREQFLLSAQHYFRTPLTALIGYLEMILSGYYGKEKLALVLSSAQELRKRIEESLDISQFQLKKAVLEKEEIQLEDLVKETVKELEIQAKEKNLKLKFDFPSEALPKLNLDKRRMREVFSNLIDNAIKHTQKGTIIISLKLQKEKNSILFFVKDTGIGISKEELPYIGTMPFERGRESKKLSPLGKGIGLYLSRLIIEAHGGRLWAESEGKNKGSTFYIELPINPVRNF
jgi:signal transduction histidine kinase